MSPAVACAATNTPNTDEIFDTEVESLTVTETQDGQVRIEGTISQGSFSVVGKLYQVYDDIDSNKIYFVESNPNYNDNIYILNLEFESEATLHNLNSENKSLVGHDVVRIAVFHNNKFYYVEQPYNINDTISHNTASISKYSNSQEMQRIVSNLAWHSYIGTPELENADTFADTFANNIDATVRTSSSAPSYDESMDALDMDIVSLIGWSNFTKVQYTYGWNESGGYILKCTEWPNDSGNILIYCLYYAITRNIPISGDNTAHLEIQLVADRQYRYIASENKIYAHLLGTDLRIYDVKLAMACAQGTAGNGYDYIYERTISQEKNDGTSPTVTIAKALVMQFDQSGVLAITDAIIDAFAEDDEVSGTSICTWPSSYSAHYTSVAHDKRANTMVRAVRVDTDGHLLNEERAKLVLAAKVADRDYENSTANIPMTKYIKYALKYNLRAENSFWGWLLGGDDNGQIQKEWYEHYTK